MSGKPSFYDPELFRRLGHQVVDRLADYLAVAQQGRLPVLPHPAPLALADRYQEGLPAAAASGAEATFLQRVQEYIDRSTHQHHPGYVAHQVAPPLPLAALTELVTGLLNQSLAVYEMSPAATHIERQTVRWLSDLLGWDAGADGIFTSGGSLGNLTGLLVARNRATQGAAWKNGVRSGPPLVILVAETAHYSVMRAAGILGLGQDGAVKVGVDRLFRMDVEALRETYRQAEQQGKQVIAVVASACTTATGTYDPLREIGEFCREHGLWFHIDGAHGASVLLSPKYKSLAAGIELADSLVWDAHKMLFVPSQATAVLFRQGPHSYDGFRQQASYLFSRHNVPDLDLGLRTVECTKRSMAWRLWLMLQVFGVEGLGEMVTHTLDLAREFAAMIKAQPDFELLTEPMTNILCFRYLPPGSPRGDEDLNALQKRIRRHVLDTGEFFLVHTRIGEAVYLRTTLLNVYTTARHLARLLELIRHAARS